MSRRDDPNAIRLADAISRLTDVIQDELRDRRRREQAERLERSYGQRPMRQLGVRPFLEHIPGLAARFAVTVPATRCVEVDDGFDVACHCGETHRLAHEQLVVADCGRAFISDGRIVRVAKDRITRSQS